MTAKKTRIKNIVTSPKGRTMLVKKPKLPIGIAAVIAGVLILVGGCTFCYQAPPQLLIRSRQ